MITSRRRETIWLGLDDDDEPQHFEVHTEDGMLMIETCESLTGNEVQVLISPALFPLVSEAISRLQEREPESQKGKR